MKWICTFTFFFMFLVFPETLHANVISTLDILHIEDDDEYILEWGAQSSGQEINASERMVSILFEDGYMKEVFSKDQRKSEKLVLQKQTKAQESSKYEVVTLNFSREKDKFTVGADAVSLYVLDTPRSDMVSFKNPKNDVEKKAKKILDAVTFQQQSHIYRIINEKRPDSPYLFALNDISEWHQFLQNSQNDYSAEEWNSITINLYHRLLDAQQHDHKLGMPFLSWDPSTRSILCYVHYSRYK
ncbi:hypothetical protein [Alteribacillus sp. HJP-4]|uniref:hypothetical protein n=1 Tax=Alteribacillus sp. HJP-4 TaxID=2775394 RepID=UPI0035CD399E